MNDLPGSDPLGEVCAVLARAFPDGKPGSLYRALLQVLGEDLPPAVVTKALDVCFGLRDMSSMGTVPQSELDAVRALLAKHGHPPPLPKT